MKEVVFLTGPYHPDFSAVSYCGYKVQKSLSGDCRLTVIALRTGLSQTCDDEFDGINIKRIDTRFLRRRLELLTKRERWVGRLKLRSHRIFGALSRLMSPVTLDKALIGAYFDALDRLPSPPDVIIPQVFPFETVQAALAYKRIRPKVKVIPYLFDDFVESGSLHVLKMARQMKRRKHLQIEGTMLDEADAILAMHPLQRHFENNFTTSQLTRIRFLEHPLLTRPPEAQQQQANDGITLCYTGSLIRGVREPNYLISLLKGLACEKSVTANFYVMGNAASQIPTLTIDGKIQIVNHGQVSKACADLAVSQADILLNLGEAQGRQVSSKIFEYMATGKPIIHLAYGQDDIVTKILSRYPLALCIDQSLGLTHDDSILVQAFVDRVSAARVPFDLVAELYPEARPDYTSKIFKDIVDNVF